MWPNRRLVSHLHLVDFHGFHLSVSHCLFWQFVMFACQRQQQADELHHVIAAAHETSTDEIEVEEFNAGLTAWHELFHPYLLKCLKGNTTWANSVILLSLFFTDSSKVTRNGSCDGTMVLGTSVFLCFHDSTCIPLATLKVYLRMDGHVLPNQNQHPVNTCMSRGSCKGLRTGLLMQPLLWNISPLRTSISPEKWWLQDVFPIEIVPF